jgi:hypothetical protein
MYFFWTKSSKPTIGISGSTKVAKMGVHTSDQWRKNLYFFPNYCILLSSISLQNVIVCYFFFTFSFRDLSNNELTGTVPEAFAQLPNLTSM